jgi:hypothetical protein
MVLCQIESNRTGRDTLPRSIEDLLKKIILKNNSLARIIQLVRLGTFGSQVRFLIPLKLKENRHSKVPVFIAGAGLEPATFGL